MAAPCVDADFHNLLEDGGRGRFAVAAERDVVEPAEWGGRMAEPRPPVDAARRDQFDHPIQLVGERRQIDGVSFAGYRAVDLTVDATEVAELVGIEVHPDRDSTAQAQDRPVVLSG